jgi:hypothetical protein
MPGLNITNDQATIRLSGGFENLIGETGFKVKYIS